MIEVPTREDYQPIIDEVSAAFREDVKKIMKREPISQEEMDRPRFFPSKIKQQE